MLGKLGILQTNRNVLYIHTFHGDFTIFSIITKKEYSKPFKSLYLTLYGKAS